MITADEVRRFALSLPGAEEKETWGHPTFRVRDKIFASMAPDGQSGTVKSTLPEQKALIQSSHDVFSVPDYVGRHGWVSVRFERVDPDALKELIVEGWRMTAPKRMVVAYDGAHPAAEG